MREFIVRDFKRSWMPFAQPVAREVKKEIQAQYPVPNWIDALVEIL
jgi:hypothetical protein